MDIGSEKPMSPLYNTFSIMKSCIKDHYYFIHYLRFYTGDGKMKKKIFEAVVSIIGTAAVCGWLILCYGIGYGF
jgi:hypothetical protein